MRTTTAAALMTVFGLGGCGLVTDPVDFATLTREFVEESMALSPVAASGAGYRMHNGRRLDAELDDFSHDGVAKRVRHWRQWQARLNRVPPATLSSEERADLELMQNLVRKTLFALEKEQVLERSPALYVQLLGQGLFTPASLEYAPQEVRCGHLLARLEAAPRFLRQAREQLRSAPRVWVDSALRESEGTRGLLDGFLSAVCEGARQAEYRQRAESARAAMLEFEQFLRNLPDEGPEAWRLGEVLYREKFALEVGGDPDALLAEAEEALKRTRRRMFDAALPMHARLLRSRRVAADVNLIVGEVLDAIALRQPSREDYFPAAAGMLAEAREFVQRHEHRLAPLPHRDNLKIIETPPFMRGIYSVGGFHAAPPLEPDLGAYYWLTPFDPGEPAASVDSRLREYNNYGLRLLTLHEAIPGHYLQFEYASRVEPPARRVLRSLFGSGVYVEGWAVYSNGLMLQEGYLASDPAMQLTFDKQLLRVIANAILDIRLHMKKMSEAEALDLLRRQTFQEPREAEGKLLRAKLSSTQLPTYFAGYQAWQALRAKAERAGGAAFSPRDFHVRALEAGALPMPTLEKLVLASPPYSNGDGRSPKQ